MAADNVETSAAHLAIARSPSARVGRSSPTAPGPVQHVDTTDRPALPSSVASPDTAAASAAAAASDGGGGGAAGGGGGSSCSVINTGPVAAAAASHFVGAFTASDASAAVAAYRSSSGRHSSSYLTTSSTSTANAPTITSAITSDITSDITATTSTIIVNTSTMATTSATALPSEAVGACTPPPTSSASSSSARRALLLRNTPTLRSATRDLPPEVGVARRAVDDSGEAVANTAHSETEADTGGGGGGGVCRQSLRFASRKEAAAAAAVAATAGLRRRTKGDDLEKTTTSASASASAASGAPVASTPEKSRRSREAWSPLDQTVFFDALGEVGKNFEALHRFIAKKMNRKWNATTTAAATAAATTASSTSDQLRNRDQIRFFYYRILNKISKFVTLDSELKRSTRELYLLINYGELRKRCAKLNDRVGQKLSELVHTGSTTVRWRGKTHRIRTPVCPALKRLNKIRDDSGADGDNCRLPLHASVQLLPADNATWCRVQALAHNPRLRAALPLQFRLRTLILALEKRWRTPDQRLMATLHTHLDTQPSAVSAADGAADRATNLSQQQQQQPPSYRLHLSVAPGFCVTPYSITPAPATAPLNLGLDQYVQRMAAARPPPPPPPPPPPLPPPPPPPPLAPEAGARQSEQRHLAAAAAAAATVTSDSPRLSFANILDELGAGGDGGGVKCELLAGAVAGEANIGPMESSGGARQCAVADNTAATTTATATATTAAAAPSASCCDQDREAALAADRLRQQAEERSRRLLERGWCADTAEAFTIGELYTMTGRPACIKLLYRLSSDTDSSSLVPPDSSSLVPPDISVLTSLLTHLVTTAQAARVKNDKSTEFAAPSASLSSATATTTASAAATGSSVCTCRGHVTRSATITCATQTPPMVAAASPLLDGSGIYYLPPSPPPASATAPAASATATATATASPAGDCSHWTRDRSMAVTSSLTSVAASARSALYRQQQQLQQQQATQGADTAAIVTANAAATTTTTNMPPPSSHRVCGRLSGRGCRSGATARRGQVVVERMLPVMPRHTLLSGGAGVGGGALSLAGGGHLTVLNLQLAPSGDVQPLSTKFVSLTDTAAHTGVTSSASVTASTCGVTELHTSNGFSIKIPQLDCGSGGGVAGGLGGGGGGVAGGASGTGGPPLKRALSPSAAKNVKRRCDSRKDTKAATSLWPGDESALYSDSSLSSNHVLTDVHVGANSNSSFTGFLASLAKSSSGPETSDNANLSPGPHDRPFSPPSTPKALNEMNDFSLTSLLGHFDVGASQSGNNGDQPTGRAASGESGSDSESGRGRAQLPTSFSLADYNTTN